MSAQPPFHAAPKNSSTPSNARQSYRGNTRGKFATIRGSTTNSRARDPERSVSRNSGPFNASATNNSSVAANSGPQWDTDENWDDNEPASTKSVQPTFCPPQGRQAPQESSRYDSGPSSGAGRQYSRGGRQFNSGQSRPGGRQSFSEDQQKNSAAFGAPTATSSGPVWDTEENWDDDEPTPGKTASPLSCPPLKNSSSRPDFREPVRQVEPQNSAVFSAPTTPSSGPSWDTNENWDDDDGAPAKTAIPPEDSQQQLPPEDNSKANPVPFAVPIIPAAGPRWDADESWDDDEPSGGNKAMPPPAAPRSVHPFASPNPQTRQPQGGASRYNSPNPQSRQSQSVGASGYNSPSPQSRQSVRGTAKFTSPSPQFREPKGQVAKFSSPNAPVVQNTTSMWGDDENWDDDSVPAPKTAQPAQVRNSQAGPPIASTLSSTLAWDTNESWDDEPGTSSASNLPQKNPSSTVDSRLLKNDHGPPAASPFTVANAPNWVDNENWDDDGAAPTPARNFPSPMSAPTSGQPLRNEDSTSSYRQPRFNNARGAARGAYRQHRANKQGAVVQGTYREYRENKERAASQGSYREEKQGNGGPATRIPYQRPPRNDGGNGRSPYQHNPRNTSGNGRSPYQQNPRNSGGNGRGSYQQNLRNDEGNGRGTYQQSPQNGPVPTQTTADIPQNDCPNPLVAPIVVTNTASLFGGDEDWD